MQARNMCRTWLYERRVTAPPNIYEAQFARRMRLAAAAASNTSVAAAAAPAPASNATAAAAE